MFIVEMICPLDDLASRAWTSGLGNLLRVFMEEIGFRAAGNREQRTAYVFRVGTAIVFIVLAVLIQVCARSKNPRRRPDCNREEFLASAFRDPVFSRFDDFSKSRLVVDPLGIKLARNRAGYDTGNVCAPACALI